MEVVGTIGAIAGIIDVCARSISVLADIRKRYKSISLTVELLAGKLQTVKAALQQIHALINECLNEDQHFQLVIDLNTSINCCTLLTRRLDEEISKLETDDTKDVNFQNKIKFVLESKGCEECQKMLDGQINALTLLITVFSVRNPVRQKEMIETKQSQKVFDRVKDDSVSLLVLCDADSFVTKRSALTTASSKFSMKFSFDGEILQTEAYKRSYRSLMKRLRAKQTRDGPSNIEDGGDDPEQRMAQERAKEVNKQLERDSKVFRRTGRIVAIGGGACKFIQTWELSTASPVEFRQFCGPRLRRHIASRILQAMHLCYGHGVWEDEAQAHYAWVLESAKSSKESIIDWTEVESVCRCCATLPEMQDYIDDDIQHCLRILEQLSSSDYTPSVEDIIRLPALVGENDIYETTIAYVSNFSVRCTCLSGDVMEGSKRVLRLLGNEALILYSVDLCSYNQSDAVGENTLLQTINRFGVLVNSPQLQNTAFVLLMTNIPAFKNQLHESPLNSYFLDYSGGDDVNKAAKYILWRFTQQDREGRNNLFPHLHELGDLTNHRLVRAAMMETLLEKVLAA